MKSKHKCFLVYTKKKKRVVLHVHMRAENDALIGEKNNSSSVVNN